MAAISKATIKQNLNDNLVVLRLIYVVSYTLAYIQIGNIFPHNYARGFTYDHALVIFAAFVLFVLSVRFYWAVGNIRRHMLERIEAAPEKELMATLKWRFRTMMFVHVPVLMAHSFIVFLLSRYLADVASHLRDGTPDQAPYKIFVAMYCGLLFLNSAWLWLLKTKGEPCPERFWMRNNAGFAAIGGILFLAGWYLNFGDQLILTVALCLFLANSALDFFYCYDAYTYERAA